jgi:hypothetical protein
MSKPRATGTLEQKNQAARSSGAPKPAFEDERLRLKTEAARALGLWDKVKAQGWGGLTAAESGAVGGYITRLKWAAKREENDLPHNSS